MNVRRGLRLCIATALLAPAAACPTAGEVGDEPIPYAGPGEEQRRRARGEEIVRLGVDLGGAEDNALACVDCHNRNAADIAEDAFRLKPGHSLYGVARRDVWLDGATTSLVDAVNFCVVSWMGGEAVPAEADEMEDLVAYLESISREGDFPPLDWRAEPFEEDDLRPGEPERGAETWARACAGCHGGAGEGGEGGPAVAGTPLSDLDVANAIRTGRGRMPFFAEDRLDADEVFDLIAYLRTL